MKVRNHDWLRGFLDPGRSSTRHTAGFEFHPPTRIFIPTSDMPRMRTLKPKKLRKGDLIAIVSPASPIADPAKIEKGTRYLESLGYRVTVGRNAEQRYGYLAGSDARRAADLHAMFGDPKVKALFCIRGGYGTPRLLRRLDYRLIARNPKILVGFSDITALQLALWTHCRLVTFHGPMVGTDMAGPVNPYTEEMLWRVLTSDKTLQRKIPFDRAVVLRRGTAEGRLIGGNLSLIVSLLGTPAAPDFRRTLLFIEEVGEEPYRVDRMLTQLAHAGVLGKANALLCGEFLDCVPKDRSVPSFTVDEILRDLRASLRVPVITHLPFGHSERKLTVPIGMRARVNGAGRSLTFLEAPVCS
jgi:muramoyltetrapeptide carboxypeptidase